MIQITRAVAMALPQLTASSRHVLAGVARTGGGGGGGTVAVFLVRGWRHGHGRSIQSATKTLVSPGFEPWRFEAHTNLPPSGENIGNASNSGLVVTCSRL